MLFCSHTSLTPCGLKKGGWKVSDNNGHETCSLLVTPATSPSLHCTALHRNRTGDPTANTGLRVCARNSAAFARAVNAPPPALFVHANNCLLCPLLLP